MLSINKLAFRILCHSSRDIPLILINEPFNGCENSSVEVRPSATSVSFEHSHALTSLCYFIGEIMSYVLLRIENDETFKNHYIDYVMRCLRKGKQTKTEWQKQKPW